MAQTSHIGTGTIHLEISIQGQHEVRDFINLLNQIRSHVATLGVTLRASAGPLDDFAQGLRRMSFVLRDAGRQFLLFGGAIAAGLTAITLEGAKFEQGMADVRSVITSLNDGTEGAEYQFRQLSQTLLQVAGDTIFTASEVTDAAKQLALAGFSVKEINESIMGIADLAAAAGEDAASVATSAVVILRGFGIAADEMDRVSDTLTAVFTNSNTTLTSLRESLKLATPAAAAFGLSIEETAAAIGILGNAGVQGSMGGTGLSRLITQLATDLDVFNELLVPLGSSADAVNPLRVGLQGAVEEFRRLIIAGKLSQEQLAKAFDERAMRALLNMLNQGSDAFDRLNEKIENSIGLTARIAAIKLDTVAGQWELLTGSISKAATEIYLTFAPALKNLLAFMTSVVDGLVNWIRENREVAKALAFTAAAVSAVTLAVGGLATALGVLLITVSALIAVISGFAGVPIALALTAIATFTTAVATLTAALFLLYVGLTSLGNIFYTLGRSVLEFFNIVDTAEEHAAKVMVFEAAFNAVAESLKNLTGESAKAARRVEELIDLLAKGNLVSENELQRATKLMSEIGVQDSGDLEKKLVELRRQRIIATRELNLLLEKSIAQGIDPDTLREQAALANAYIDKIDENIARLESSKLTLSEIEESINRARFGTVDSAEATLGSYIDIYQEEIDKITAQLAGTLDESMKSELERQSAKFQSQMDALVTAKGFISSFDQDTFKEFLKGFDAGGFAAGIDAVNQYKAALQEAIEKQAQLTKEADEAFKDLAELLPETARGLQADFDSQLAELQKLKEDIGDAIDTILDDPTNDLVSFEELAQMYQDATENIAARKQKLLDTLNETRDDEILRLKRERAEADKDVVEAVRLLREQRQREVDKKVEELFDTKSDLLTAAELAQIEADKKDFITESNLETERLVANLEEQFKKETEIKDVKKEINLEETERNKLEADVTNQLIEQVQSLKDAVAITQFLRAESRKRVDDAKRAAIDQEKAESRLLETVRKRAEIEAAGGDTTAIDAKIRRQRNAAGFATDVANLRRGEAGFKKFESNFQVEIEQAKQKGVADAAAQAATKKVTSQFSVLADIVGVVSEGLRMLPKDLLDSIKGAVNNIPAIPIKPVPVQPPQNVPNLNAPGNPQLPANAKVENKITDNRVANVNINGAGDPKKVAEQVMDYLGRGGLGFNFIGLPG